VIAAQGRKLAIESSLSAFPFDRPDPVRFFGIITVFLGHFGTRLVFGKIAKTL
jgi:hypothetical protein